MNNNVVITLDIDWAPDFVIDFVAEQLIEHQIRATWFVTHLSPAVERLRQQPELFELGIHPNFLPGSTHGSTPDTVLRHCMAMVPEATSVRTHALAQSTPLLRQILTHTTITTDISLFLPHMPLIRPVEYHWQEQMLLRIPYFWEDDLEMERPAPCWHLRSLLDIGEGLKVFDFHPIHIYLNSTDMMPYQRLKQRVPMLVEATPTEVNTHIQVGIGTQTIFIELVEHLASREQSLCIRDIYEQWQVSKAGKEAT